MTSPHDRHEEGAPAPFHLILAETRDLTALRICGALRRVARAEFVTPDELFMARHWSHDPLGQSRVELASGLVLTEESVLSIFNRVAGIAPLQFAASHPEDQRYAAEEFFALLVSWLTGFGARCVNRPHPGAIAGFSARSPVEDRLRLGADLHASSRARHLGLGARVSGFPEPDDPVLPGGPGQHISETRAHRVLVVGDCVSGDLPATLRQRLLAEMARRGLSLAEVGLAEAVDGWRPVFVNPLPEAEHDNEVALISGHLLGLAQAERGAA